MICTTLGGAMKKGEGGWKTTYKLALIQLVETEKEIFLREVMRG